MNIHITLVGGQNLPIYNGILRSNPDKIIFIHSNKTLEQSRLISSIVGIESEFIEINPTNFKSISVKMESVVTIILENKVSVNLTGGTKLMSLAAFSISMKNNINDLFYLDQNNVEYDFFSNTSKQIDISISIETYFRLSGNKIKSFNIINKYDPNAINSFEKIRQLMEFAPREYYSLMGSISYKSKNHNRIDEYSTKNGSVFNYDKETNQIVIILKSKNSEIRRQFAFNDVYETIVHTKWFEFEVASLLMEWKYTTEIYHSVVVPYNSGADKNEIDLVLNAGQKWIFIECKTQVNDIKDIDKFRNVAKNYGGLGAKSILITDAVIKSNVKEKCEDNNILTFSIEQAKHNKLFSVNQSLYLLLESELFSSNPN
jgi:hypothetical protein